MGTDFNRGMGTDFKSVPYMGVRGKMDLGLLSLLMIARHHGIAADEAQLRHEFGPKLFTVETILLGAKRLGMTARLVTQDQDRLDRAPLPAIAIDKERNFFIAVKFGYDSGDKTKPRIITQQPGNPTAQVMTQQDFLERWSGQFIFFISKMNYMRDLSKFDFSWFIPAIVKYRRLLGEVMLISFVLQLIALITPLGFQVVMDKVLVQKVHHISQDINLSKVIYQIINKLDLLMWMLNTIVFVPWSNK